MPTIIILNQSSTNNDNLPCIHSKALWLTQLPSFLSARWYICPKYSFISHSIKLEKVMLRLWPQFGKSSLVLFLLLFSICTKNTAQVFGEQSGPRTYIFLFHIFKLWGLAAFRIKISILGWVSLLNICFLKLNHIPALLPCGKMNVRCSFLLILQTYRLQNQQNQKSVKLLETWLC